MKRLLFAHPESFSFAPLLALLPVQESTIDLSQLKSSFYARYEKVNSELREQLASGGGEVKDLLTEQGMLRQVLDYLQIRPTTQISEGE